jgi:hypothetical protein
MKYWRFNSHIFFWLSFFSLLGIRELGGVIIPLDFKVIVEQIHNRTDEKIFAYEGWMFRSHPSVEGVSILSQSCMELDLKLSFLASECANKCVARFNMCVGDDEMNPCFLSVCYNSKKDTLKIALLENLKKANYTKYVNFVKTYIKFNSASGIRMKLSSEQAKVALLLKADSAQ